MLYRGKNFFAWCLLALVSLGLAVFFSDIRVVQRIFPGIALAEDEDEDEDEHEDEDEDEDEDDSANNETKTVTTYVKLPDQIIKKQIITTIYDSDGDGVFDDVDPTPDINDNLIVQDDNRNGIVDDYE